MTDYTTSIVSLPSELLIIIFEYCSAIDLARLSQVCMRFHEIIKEDLLWSKKSHLPLVTNQRSERFLERCNDILCDRSKWRISCNWRYGRYNRALLLQQRVKVIPKIRMKQYELWWCGNSLLCSFKRTRFLDTENEILKCTNNRCDFSSFVLMKNYIVTGDNLGTLIYWPYDSKDKVVHLTSAHDDDIMTIDGTSEVIITGSLDKTIKIFPTPKFEDNGITTYYDDPVSTLSVTDRIWSLKANLRGTTFAIGTSGNETKPLQIYDIEECVCLMQMSHDWRRGAGILDIIWENPQTILTCGYDTFIRKWDLRSGRCVNSWGDPSDATLYCISSDYNYTMISGTQFNCMAVLWDQRQRNYVQLYFMQCPGINNKSPIYSLAFDNTHLYCATDRYLVELEFSESTKRSIDYSGIK